MNDVQKTNLKTFFNLTRAGAILTMCAVSISGMAQAVSHMRQERQYSEVFTNAASCRAKLATAESCTVEEQQSMAIRELFAERRLKDAEKIFLPLLAGSLF
jgi:hypothetical protein